MEVHLIRVPAGMYTFGVPACPADVQHKWDGPADVFVKPFLLAEHSVTVGEYVTYLRETAGSIPPWFAHLIDQPADWPAGGVSWHDATAYAEWLRRNTGKPYRLPACDEWEAAARGGLTGKRYPWGDGDPVGRCNFAYAAPAMTAVGSYPPNGFGLYDMAGSIWNWCSDVWSDRVPCDPPVNRPTGRDPAGNRVLRGGSFMTEIAGYLMCACIHEDPPDLRHPGIGMRLACDAI